MRKNERADRDSDEGTNMVLQLLALVAYTSVAGAVLWVATWLWLNRQHARNAGLRAEIEAQLRFATTVDYARINRVTAFGHNGRAWVSLGSRRPMRLIVGTDTFIFEAPNAFKEYVFRGAECSIAFSQEPSSVFVRRNWIVITGLAGGRQVQLAISSDNLMDVWQALTGTGVAYGHRSVA
jgi:hypothetical protein